MNDQRDETLVVPNTDNLLLFFSLTLSCYQNSLLLTSHSIYTFSSISVFVLFLLPSEIRTKEAIADLTMAYSSMVLTQFHPPQPEFRSSAPLWPLAPMHLLLQDSCTSGHVYTSPRWLPLPLSQPS